MTGWGTAALVAAVITNGLMAGLFAAYSYAVMPGLGRAGDRTFVEAMQQTNAAILNGWFGDLLRRRGGVRRARPCCCTSAGRGCRGSWRGWCCTWRCWW